MLESRTTRTLINQLLSWFSLFVSFFLPFVLQHKHLMLCTPSFIDIRNVSSLHCAYIGVKYTITAYQCIFNGSRGVHHLCSKSSPSCFQYQRRAWLPFATFTTIVSTRIHCKLTWYSSFVLIAKVWYTCISRVSCPPFAMKTMQHSCSTMR